MVDRKPLTPAPPPSVTTPSWISSNQRSEPPAKRRKLPSLALQMPPIPDELGKIINSDVARLSESTLHQLFRKRQGRGNFTKLHKTKHHPAHHLLRQLGTRGAPVLLRTAPWGQGRKDAAIARGPHKSAREFLTFLRGEMADMVRKAIWMVLPYSRVKHLKNLRVSPIGVVPQHSRRPRTIVDYSFSDVNGETLHLSPREAMQFGRALERLITQVVHSDPRFGPVHFIKIDLADGFYQVWARTEDIPKLGVAFPELDGEEPLIAFPLALPMGWTESPPYFCAVTETIADLANERILKWRNPIRHNLEPKASTPPENATGAPQTLITPPVKACPTRPMVDTPAPPRPTTTPWLRDPSLTIRNPRILSQIDVFVDDFLGAAQGSKRRLNRVRRILMHAIDDVFRPVDGQDPSHRRAPISISKLMKGDACWTTVKTMLGWILDSVAMTLTLPPRRLQRLAELLESIPTTQKRLSIKKWHKLLGELRSMALALPGARGLFSHLQVAQQSLQHGRSRLHRGFHDAINDFRWLQTELASRPT